jgi:hypothetical protein
MYRLPFCSGAKTHLGVGDVGDELSEGPHIRCGLIIVALGWHSIRRFEKITLSDGIELLQFGNEGIRGLRKGARRSEQATYDHRKVFHEGSPEFRSNNITKGRKAMLSPFGLFDRRPMRIKLAKHEYGLMDSPKPGQEITANSRIASIEEIRQPAQWPSCRVGTTIYAKRRDSEKLARLGPLDTVPERKLP